MQNLFSVIIAICVGFTLADPADRSAGLAAHNEFRAKHHSPPLTLDNDKINSAQSWAQTMASTDNLDHRPAVAGLSESLFKSSNLALSDSDAYVAATNSWYSEVSAYDYNNPQYTKDNGHFVNMIWKTAPTFGIGVARSATYVYVCAVYDYTGGSMADNVLKP